MCMYIYVYILQLRVYEVFKHYIHQFFRRGQSLMTVTAADVIIV